MNRRNCPRRIILACVLALIALSPVQAGAQNGRIGGGVASVAGVELTEVTVTLFDQFGERRVSSTDGAGRFEFTGLPPGTYRLTAVMSGYSTAAVDNIVVADEPVEVPLITVLLVVVGDPVVVTATRTAEPLRDVPMSVSAFTGEDIERRDLEDVAEIAHWTPGLTVVDQGARGSDVLIVRGLHTNSLNGSGSGDTGVATYVGDVPVRVDLRLSDIERVEVLLSRRAHCTARERLPAPFDTSLAGRTPNVTASTCARTCSDSRTADPRAQISASPSTCQSFERNSRCVDPSTASPILASSTTTTC